ncbi:MAG: hypothetical protein M3P53_00900 [Actinomycetota bacterium]|nr:hypothetical protein [Actinomycetota bacterium]
MTNGTDHQRFHEIAFEAKKRLAWAIEQAVREGGDTEDCACVRDLAEAFAILPLPHAHDGGRAHTHPAPPMAHSMIEVMPLPPELEERLDDLLEQAGSEVSPEALRDQLQDLQRAVSAAVLALARAVRDGARDGATAANCRCLRQGGGDPDALAGPDGRRDDAAHPRQHAGRCTGISFEHSH